MATPILCTVPIGYFFWFGGFCNLYLEPTKDSYLFCCFWWQWLGGSNHILIWFVFVSLCGNFPHFDALFRSWLGNHGDFVCFECFNDLIYCECPIAVWQHGPRWVKHWRDSTRWDAQDVGKTHVELHTGMASSWRSLSLMWLEICSPRSGMKGWTKISTNFGKGDPFNRLEIECWGTFAWDINSICSLL